MHNRGYLLHRPLASAYPWAFPLQQWTATSVWVEVPSFLDELVAFFRFFLKEKQLMMLTNFNPIQKNRDQAVSGTYVLAVFT